MILSSNKRSRLYSGAVIFGILGLILAVNTCKQFEPEGFLHITTDTAAYANYGSYLMTGSVVEITGDGISQHGFSVSDSPLPTIDSPLSSELGPMNATGGFSDFITGLAPGTTYHVRAYAVSKEGTSYGEEKSVTPPETVIDIDDNIYRTVVIGEQTWMAENMRATRYADGSPIPMVEEDVVWEGMTPSDRAYCWYENDPENGGYYGALYSWAAASNSDGLSEGPVQGVCPEGWHLPDDEEWKQLEKHLGMSPEAADAIDWRGTDEGGKLKSSGMTTASSPLKGPL